MKLFLKMKSFRTCLDIIPEKITTSTKMQGTLKTPQTHASAEHVAQKTDQFVQMHQAPAIILPYIEALRLS